MHQKTVFVKLLSFIVVFGISISSNALAMEMKDITATKLPISIEQLKENILLKTDKSTSHENIVEYSNIDSFVNKAKTLYSNMNDVDLAEEIMRATGDDEKTISTTPEKKKLEILNCTSVTRTESFFIEAKDPDASPIQVDEKTFYKHVDEVKEKQQGFSLGSNLSQDSVALATSLPEEQWTDGCLLVKSNAYKIPRRTSLPGRDIFVIRATAQWITYPFFKGRDQLAIASAGQKDNEYPSDAMACYEYCDWGTVSEEIEYVYEDYPQTFGMELVNDSIYGVSVNFDLEPIDDPDRITYKKLKQISLWYGITTQSDVTSQVSYAHATYGLGGIEVSLSPGGVSFSAPISQGWEEFKLPAFTLYYDYPYQ